MKSKLLQKLVMLPSTMMQKFLLTLAHSQGVKDCRMLIMLPLLLLLLSKAQTQTVVTQTTAGTYSFTVPGCVSSITVECIGGGGNGGGRSSSSGVCGGGGGGAYASSVISVTPGQNYSYTVGAVGAIGAVAGTSTFGTGPILVSAVGGAGVANNTTTGGAGGLASSAFTFGTIEWDGGTGATGSGTYGGGGGSSGGAASAGNNGGNPSVYSPGVAIIPGGIGGAGRSTGTSGIGVTPVSGSGGGGGGAYRSSSGSSAGGAGKPGMVRITYTVSPPTGATLFTSSSLVPGSGTATIGFTRGTGDGGVVVIGCVGAAPTAVTSGSYAPADGANGAFGSGTALGSGFIVFVENSTGSGIRSVNLSGLTSGSQYFFAIYEYNAPGSCWVTTPLSGSFCFGPPAVATVTSSVNPVCAGASSTLGLTGLSAGGLYTYAWQNSSTSGSSYGGSSGTATNATYATPTTLPSSPAYYVCQVTCPNTSNTIQSAELTQSVQSYLLCYCNTGLFAAAATTARGVVNVVLNGNAININQASTPNTTSPYYTLYSTPVADMSTGSPYTLAVTVGTQASNNYATAWIDYDHSGTFDASNSAGVNERIGSFGPVNASTTNNIGFTVPASAIAGTTAMRVFYRYNSSAAALAACGQATGTATTGGAGEVEDYRVTICTPPTSQVTGVTVPTINTTDATFNWTARNDGTKTLIIIRRDLPVSGTPSTAYNDNPDYNFGYPAGSPLGSGNVMFGDLGADNATSATITGLHPGTKYYYALYSYNFSSHCYNLTSPVTGNFTTLACTTTLQPTIVGISCVDYTTMNLRFNRGNGNRAIVLAKAGSAVDADPVYNTSYTANQQFGSGSQIGTGNYVVYDGNDAGVVTVPLTGLNASTTYNFKIYEYNTFPNCYNITSPLSLSQATRSPGLFTSNTCVQTSTNVVYWSINQDIVKLQVVVSGGNDPSAVVNSITFTTTGTTNVADLTAARIYYTGTTATFTATTPAATQYGSTINNPSGTYTVTDKMVLTGAGTHNFWIAYDIAETATVGNVVDATIPSFNLTDFNGQSDRTPTVIAPVGNRAIIALSAPSGYCTANATNGYANGYCYLTGVQFAGITYPIVYTAVYNNQTAAPAATVLPGQTYPFTGNFFDDVLFGTISVWIDWNRNGVFDASEIIINQSSSNSNYIPNLLVPADAQTGPTRMRCYVRNNNEPGMPCSTSTAFPTPDLGHIIDYTVIITSATPPAPVICSTLKPVVNNTVTYIQGDAALPLEATGTGLLWYTAASGGTGSGTVPTPTTSASGTTAYYVSQNIGCEGPRTQIAVIVTPASGPLAPVASATQPTCSVSTGSVDLSGLPSSGTWTINPNAITGSGITQTISSVTVGTYSYTVTNSAGCISPTSNSVVISSPTVPMSPTVGTITQPTCSLATGSVNLSDLPAGNWTINPGAITGSTTGTTINSLTANTTYNFTVTDASGCTSLASTDVVINAQPASPDAPTVNTITQPTCTVATGSVNLSGLPAGNWTINPGAIAGSTTSTTISGLTASTTYNFTVTSAGCTSLPSADIVINAQPATPLAPTASATQITVNIGDPINLFATTVSGATYNWTGPNGFISTNQNPVISNAQTTNAGNYSVNATKAGCISIASNIVTITVNSSCVPPTITGLTTDCEGETRKQYYTESGKSGYVWTITDGGSITSGQGTYLIEVRWNAPGKDTISVIYNGGGCPLGTPAIKEVTIIPNAAIFNQPSNAAIKAGKNTSFSVVAVNGADTLYPLIYKWQVQYHGTGAWVNITDGGAHPAYSKSDSAHLILTGVADTNSTNKYRCIVSPDSHCNKVTSNPATLTVNPGGTPGLWVGGTTGSPQTLTDWNVNSNWDGDLKPGNGQDVTIPASAINQPVIYNDGITAVCKNLTINPKASLTVNAGGTFSPEGNMIIKSDATGTGAFKRLDGANVNISSINVTVQRYIQGPGYHYISSPLSGVQCNGIISFAKNSYNEGKYYNPDLPFPASAFPNMWRIDEKHTHAIANADYNSWYAPLGTEVMSSKPGWQMVGYAINMPAAATLSITKPGSALNEGNYEYSVSKEAISTDTYHNGKKIDKYGQTDLTNGTLAPSGPTNGWHLVGNPYPSPVDWKAVVNGNSVGANIGFGIAFFKPTDQYYGIYGSYFYNKSITQTSGAFPPSRYIPSMQSFFIQNSYSGGGDNTPLLSFKNAYCNVSSSALSGNFYKKDDSSDNLPGIALNGYKDDFSEIQDKLVIKFGAEFTAGKLMNTDLRVPNLYSFSSEFGVRSSEKGVSIQGINELKNDLIVPLGFEVNTNGKYIISASEILNLPTGMHVYLQDVKNKVSQDLNVNPAYNFNINKDDDNNRFFLKFVNLQSANLQSAIELFDAYSYDKTLHINYFNPDNKQAVLSICNTLGQQLKQFSILNSQFSINLDVAPGAYLVRLVTKDNVYIKKVYLQ